MWINLNHLMMNLSNSMYVSQKSITRCLKICKLLRTKVSSLEARLSEFIKNEKNDKLKSITEVTNDFKINVVEEEKTNLFDNNTDSLRKQNITMQKERRGKRRNDVLHDSIVY